MKNYSCLSFDYWQYPSVKNLSRLSMLVNTYLATYEHLNLIGVGRITKSTICGDLNLTLEEVDNAYSEISKYDFIIFCDKTDHYYIPSILKWFPIIDINKTANSQTLFKRIPDLCTFKSYFYQQNEFVLNIDVASHRAAKKAGTSLPSPFEARSKPLPSPFQAPSKPLPAPFEVCSSSSSCGCTSACTCSSSDLIFGNQLSLYFDEFNKAKNPEFDLDFDYVFKKFYGCFLDKHLNSTLALIRFSDFVKTERPQFKTAAFHDGINNVIYSFAAEKTKRELDLNDKQSKENTTEAGQKSGLEMARQTLKNCRSS